MATQKTEGAEKKEKTADKPPDKPQRSKKAKCCRCLFWTFSVVIAVAAILAGFLWRLITNAGIDVPVEVVENIGHDGVQLFFQHDMDGDGYLTIREYEALYLLLKGHGTNVSYQDWAQGL